VKRPFLLFEVLIAIFLVSFCLIPLIRSPIQSYRNEVKLLEEMEGEKWAEWTFSEVKEKLLNNDLEWDKIPKPGETSPTFSLPPITLELPNISSKTINRSFSLRCTKKGEKEGKNGEISRILWVDLFFTPKVSQRKPSKHKGDYSFRLMVQLISNKSEK
jgi:hypothetical protein